MPDEKVADQDADLNQYVLATSAPQTSMIFEVVMIDGVVGTGS
jgi:hypothetical protein